MNDIIVKEYIKFGLAMVLLYTFFDVVGVGCPIRFLTGVSCAGCGMTRAWISLLHLEIKGAFYYHPLFILPIVYFFLFLFKDKVCYKIFSRAIVIGIGIFTAVYIFRLLDPDDAVVSINIKIGFIYKFLELLQ